MATEPKNGAPQRDMNTPRTPLEAHNTQECMNQLAADLAAKKAALKAAQEKAATEEAAKNENQ